MLASLVMGRSWGLGCSGSRKTRGFPGSAMASQKGVSLTAADAGSAEACLDHMGASRP